VRQAAADELQTWYTLYEATMRRHGLEPAHRRNFDLLFEQSGRSGATEPHPNLLMAYGRNEPLAGAVVATCGSRAWYLYAASSYTHRRLMASYAVQWKAIELVSQRGCTRYDLLGIPPTPDAGHPMSGLYHFKTGFGGRRVHRRGCWDYPLDRERYEAFRAAEAATGRGRLAGR
jgi:hypothetical protein